MDRQQNNYDSHSRKNSRRSQYVRQDNPLTPFYDFHRTAGDAEVAVEAAAGKFSGVASTCRQNDFFGFVGDCPAEPDAAFYGYGQNCRCGRRCQQSASFRTERNCCNRFAAVINAVLSANSKALEAFDAGFVVDGFAPEVNTAGWTSGCAKAAGNTLFRVNQNFLRAWTASRPRRVPTG